MFFLIVGLGNPGKTYRNTRHNLGFGVVDRLAERHGISVGQKKFHGKFGSGSIGDKRVGLLKPLTYMNLSGEAVTAAVNYLKIPLERVLIAHDDVDLALGRIQVKSGGGHGGHRGLQSVIESLNQDDFARIRIGVDRPMGENEEVSDYVLEPFSTAELSTAGDAVGRAAEAAVAWLEDGLTTAMNQYNSWPGQES
jgi:PTH1 family peptidyl-tRNA hydrolase